MNISRMKRLKISLFFGFFLCLMLVVRVGFIQFVNGEELQAKAYVQQTLNRNINPKRGTIYDATGNKILAMSASVETVTITPTNIAAENKEKVAKALTDIFGLEYETVLKKVNKRSSIETIIKKVDKEKADELRIWMQQNNITKGINIDEDTKRYYPYSSLACTVIGFTGSDNQGLEGIEKYYDDILKGEQGQILKMTDATGRNLGTEGEDYIEAVDGDDLVLTIDMNVQAIAEKYLEEACIDNECTGGGNVIIANPKTGDILALASYPKYDLNAPYTINNEELATVWSGLSSQEKNTYLQQMWRNKATSDTYEPGSTFKIVTSSIALEEGITNTDNSGEFACTGSINIAGTRIKCWRHYRPHGSQSLRQALMNSCNPVFIGLGQKIGKEKYYDYLEKFGLLSKTGIDVLGEASSIFLKEEKVGPVELATISFGQRFEITPMQMVKMASIVANGGKEVEPRLLKGVIDSETGERKDLEVKEGEQVISKETADKVLSMMESVVAEGTGKGSQVAGYRIGGKTGTSEDGVNTGKYIASFLGIADISNPEVVILVVLYNPTGEGGHQGGGIAAPLAGQILSDVLAYLEVGKGNSDIIEEPQEVIVPEITGMTIQEAEKILQESDFKLEINAEIENRDNTAIIKNQIPKAGIRIYKGNSIYVDL